MNYSNAKSQLHQIVITEIAKYFQKSISPVGLSLEDLKCLEVIARLSEFEQDLKDSAPEKDPTKDKSIDELLAIVKSGQSNERRE